METNGTNFIASTVRSHGFDVKVCGNQVFASLLSRPVSLVELTAVLADVIEGGLVRVDVAMNGKVFAAATA
jgi:hypothetical protein